MLSSKIQACFPARLRTLIRMSYGSRLEKAMELAEADRNGLAKAVGVSVQAIGMVLGGKSNAFAAENHARAAQFLSVDHFWLATGEGEPRPPYMKERAALSSRAVEFAAAFDALEPGQQALWRTLVLAAGSHAPDERVAQAFGLPPNTPVPRDERAQEAFRDPPKAPVVSSRQPAVTKKSKEEYALSGSRRGPAVGEFDSGDQDAGSKKRKPRAKGGRGT